MHGRYSDVAIKGIVSVVPKNELDNLEYMNQFGDRRVKKQILLTGIEKRRACINGQTAGDLCTVAAEHLIKRLGWKKNNIKALIYVTQSPDFQRPSTSYLIQKRLGIGKNCIVFDVNLGCVGYIAGLQIIAGILHNCGGRGLLLAGESIVFENGTDMSTSSLLNGDAGSATAVEIEQGHRLYYKQWSDGNKFHYLYKTFDKPAYMDGNGVLLFGLNEVVKSFGEFKETFQIQEEEVDYYVLHQAQKLIIDGIAENAGLPMEKILYSCKGFGNTSSASIPLTICVNIDRFKDKKKLCLYCCGFGIGLSWGSALIEIETACIEPIIETQKYYDDREKKNE